MGIAADQGVDHRAALEVHRALVVAQQRRDRERARLPTQIEQLKHIVDAKLAKRPLDRHQATSCRLRKMRSRSAAVRASRCARRAKSLSGATSTTSFQSAMASR